MYLIQIGLDFRNLHSYCPTNAREAQSVAHELSRDFRGEVIAVHRPDGRGLFCAYCNGEKVA